MLNRFNFIGLMSFLLLFGCSTTHFEIIQPELNYPADLKLIKRSEWGWQPSEQKGKVHQIKYITVHHGGVEFTPDKSPIERVRNLQSWSRNEKLWYDIPYHFMIDLDGNIYEARPINISGDTNTEYDPTSHALVEVMGNYEVQELSDEQYQSMVGLLKYLSDRFDVPVDRIKTHRDYSNQTVCPGNNIYQYFTDGSIENALN